MKDTGLVILVTAIVGLSAGFAESPVGFENIDAAAARALVERAEREKLDLVILDVRTAEEYAEGHIEGAAQLDFFAEKFEEKLDGLGKSKTYLLHCRSGRRSAQARELMRKLGFKTVFHLDGGIQAWVDAGGEVVRAEKREE